MQCSLVNILLVSITLTIVTQQSSLSADPYWPGWLGGSNRDGYVADFNPPLEWPTQLEQGWQVDVGTGYSSPLLANGHVFQQARQGEHEVIWCLDLRTGNVVWRKSYAAPFTIGGGAESHGKGPKSSPALAKGRLFTLSIAGILRAWDANTGKLLWQSDFSSRFANSHPRWGASGSPLVVDNRVVIHLGTDGEGALVAFDVDNGNELWTSGKVGPSYSSPLHIEINKQRQIVDWNEQALVSVDSETGRQLWNLAYPQTYTDQNMPTPVFHQGVILLGAENRGIRALRPQFAGNTWSVRERWYQEDVALDMSSAVINANLLYGFSHYDQGRIFCLDPQTGKVLWKGPPRTGENVTFLAIPNHILALVNDGQLKIIQATGEKYNNIATYRVAQDDPYSTWAPSALLQNGILIKAHQTLTLWRLDGS